MKRVTVGTVREAQRKKKNLFGRHFQIVEIVEANCQRVEEYEPSESANKNTLGYYEDLNLNLSGTDYILLLTFDTSEIYLVHFHRKNP